ncbi:hypothetical protein KXW37_004023, partial [Aspergillus fumigatus]
PVADCIDIVIQDLKPDTQAVREAVAAELQTMFRRETVPSIPGDLFTLSRSWIEQAVSNATGERSNTVFAPSTDITFGPGIMPCLRSGPQDPHWCPQNTDDALPAVLGLMPPGPAWDGAAVEGTVQNSYWRAYANVLSYTYQRLCKYVDEFFCKTVNESLDQWIAEYG